MRGAGKRIRWFYLFLSFFFQAVTVVVGKKASMHMEQFRFSAIVSNPYYLLVLACLVFQAFFWQQTLKYLDLSYAYMFMALLYPVILLSGYFFYGEQVSGCNLIGTGIIVVGVLILVRSA